MLAVAGQKLTDEDLVRRVCGSEPELFEVVMRRYNARLFRVARAIVKDDDEAEDVLQEAYVHAFHHLAQFAGRAKFSTWLIKITVHEALARLRKERRRLGLEERMAELEDDSETLTADNPERAAQGRELAVVLEAALDSLPDGYRAAFVLREVEGLSTAEAAACLDVTEDALKVRLHRAKAALRVVLEQRLGSAAREVYAFHLSRCDRVVARVLARTLRHP